MRAIWQDFWTPPIEDVARHVLFPENCLLELYRGLTAPASPAGGRGHWTVWGIG